MWLSRREKFSPTACGMVEKMFNGHEKWYYVMAEYAAQKFDSEKKRLRELFTGIELEYLAMLGAACKSAFQPGMTHTEFLGEVGRLEKEPMIRARRFQRYRDVDLVDLYARIRRLSLDELFVVCVLVSAAKFCKESVRKLPSKQRNNRCDTRTQIGPWYKYVIGISLAEK